jgi:hypothetical protein
MSSVPLESEAAVPEGCFAPVAQPEGRPRPYPVMLLQGIVRSRFSLMRMARGLAAAGFEVYNLGGPSPRLPLEKQVARFRRDLEQLGRELARRNGGEAPVMHGVGHSMGGVVLRVALAQAESIVPGRVVAIATPFLGTRVAEVVCRHRVARRVMGEALRDLTWHSAAIRRLAESAGEQPVVGVVLGQPGFQLLLPSAWINAWIGVKNTDGTIQPASARGDGLWPPPADVLTVRTGHTFMAEKAEVIRQTAHFLAPGRFARTPRSDV